VDTQVVAVLGDRQEHTRRAGPERKSRGQDVRRWIQSCLTISQPCAMRLWKGHRDEGFSTTEVSPGKVKPDPYAMVTGALRLV